MYYNNKSCFSILSYYIMYYSGIISENSDYIVNKLKFYFSIVYRNDIMNTTNTK